MQNLWPEFDNELSSHAEGQAQNQLTSQSRRPSEQVILSSLRNWLLQDYVASYCRSLAATRIYRRCYWVDGLGFHLRTRTQVKITPTSALIEPHPEEDVEQPEPPAKKGRKKNVVQEIPPLLQPVMSLAQELAQGSRPIALHSFLLEAGSSRRRDGRATGDENAGKNAAISLPKESGIVHASWLEVAPKLLEVIDQSPAIFLLNPFGPATFMYDDLIPLYQRTAPTELCLFISHKQVEMRLLPSLRAPAGASALTSLLRSDRWKALLTKHEENKGILDDLLDLLMTSMQRHFLSVQRIAFPMQVRPTVVEVAACTLIFATRRQDSLICMNDALCTYRRRLQEESARGVLIEEWFVRQQRERHEEEVRQLYERVLQQGRAQRVRRWPDLRQQLLIAHFGQFTLGEYDEALRKLLESGEVRCEWRRRPVDNVESEESRVPGNDDVLLWK